MSVTTYTTVNGRILRQNKDGVVHNFVSDPLGSVVMVRDTSGNTVYEAEYDPYGNVQSETGTNPSSLGYVGTLGYIKDSATSMYVRARYLLSNLGRWLTKDPLWPSEAGYVYAGAAPSISVDPSGAKPVKNEIRPVTGPTCYVYSCDVNPGRYWVAPGHRFVCSKTSGLRGSRSCSAGLYPATNPIIDFGVIGDQTHNCPPDDPSIKCTLIVAGDISSGACAFAQSLCKCMKQSHRGYSVFGSSCLHYADDLLNCACRGAQPYPKNSWIQRYCKVRKHRYTTQAIDSLHESLRK